MYNDYYKHHGFTKMTKPEYINVSNSFKNHMENHNYDFRRNLQCLKKDGHIMNTIIPFYDRRHYRKMTTSSSLVNVDKFFCLLDNNFFIHPSKTQDTLATVGISTK